MALRVLVLGEGKSEEGDDYYAPEQPGRAIPEECLGAAHVLVRRILIDLAGSKAPTFVYPPRLRTSRRPGNGGLIADLSGAPRLAANPRQKGWLQKCVGENAVDLIVLLKDCKVDGRACGVDVVIGELQSAIAGRLPPRRPKVVKAAAKPSLEGWLLMMPESNRVEESQAKAMWASAGFDSGHPPSMAGVARDLDLAKLQTTCPASFGGLVAALKMVLALDEAPPSE